MESEMWTADCMARHIGPWCVEPVWFREAFAAVQAGLWSPRRTIRQPSGMIRFWKDQELGDGECSFSPRRLAYDDDEPSGQRMDARRALPSVENKPYPMTPDGIAVVSIDGQMQKGESKYGGTNSVVLRRVMRQAVTDGDVKGIMMMVDSPGGTVAGTAELAADVARANALKPVHAHIEDLGASAAYWVASQARAVTATPTSEIGSIGVLAVVEDFSKLYDMKGVKVHVISTGAYKGAGIEGAPVNEEQLAYWRDLVQTVHQHFLSAVAAGRGKSLSAVEAWADGRVFMADKAEQMGMIDKVTSVDGAMEILRAEIAREEVPGTLARARESVLSMAAVAAADDIARALRSI